MYKNKKIIAIIPARGGSKGILNKNIVNVLGKPLIEYTIEAAKASKYIDYIYVSTDSELIANVCMQKGINVPQLRPAFLATDEAKIIDVLSYTLNFPDHRTYDYCLLLQPTQPLRRVKHIDEAIEKIVPDQCESIVSVSEVSEHPIFMREINSYGVLEPIINTNSTVRRQDLKNVYRVNGAIYINKVEDILNKEISLNDNLYPYVMDKEYDLDIDDNNDLEKFIKIQSESIGLF